MNWRTYLKRLIKELAIAFGVASLVISFMLLLIIGAKAFVSTANAVNLEPQVLVSKCLGQANFITDIAYFRDNGITEESLVDTIKADKDLNPDYKENIIYNVGRVYARTDLTAKQMGDIVYGDCMNPPRDV